MLYYFLQIYDTIVNRNIYPYEYFITFSTSVYLIRAYYSKKYRPYLKDYDTTKSAIVTVLREDHDVFEKCLKSIKGNVDNLIVVLDLLEDDEVLRDISNKYANIVIKADKKGKRASIDIGLRYVSEDITILVDSDTVFEDGAINELVKPFIDKSVGGVTTKQKIFKQKKNYIRRIAAWMEDIRFSVGSIPCQSVFGQVGCLPGRAIAFRTKYLVKVMPEFLDETFLGKPCVSGDDRNLTSLIIKSGYKTVYQSSSLVYTDCPNDLKTFVKQQLRWSRSSQRETVMSLGWLFRYPMTFFIFITDLVMPFAFLFVILNSIYRYIVGDTYLHIPIVVSLGIALVGMYITFIVKYLRYIDWHVDDLKYIIVFIMYMTFIMTPIRVVGFFTMNDSSWMTRNKKLEEVKK